MTPWAWVAAAAAHEGEDHAAPAPPAAAADGTSWATWSTEFEAVLRVPHAHAGDTVQALLHVADFATSAPVPGAELRLVVGEATLAPRPTDAPGVYAVALAIPPGSTTASLQVLTETRSDVLGFPPRALAEAERSGVDAPFLSTPVVAGLVVLALIVGLLVGRGLGRRTAGAAVLLGLVGGVGVAPGVAHEGDHGAPALAVAGASAGAPGAGLHLPVESQFLIGLRTLPVRRGLVEETLEVLGTTESPPGGRADVEAPVGGWLVPGDVKLAPGTVVRRGDVLARIVELQPGAERATAAIARSGAFVALAEAERELALAERDLARGAELSADVLSERERLARERAVDVARERLRQSGATIDQLASQVPTTVLRSPIDGVISRVEGRPGDLVGAGDALLRVVARAPLWVVSPVPTALAHAVPVAGAASVVADARPDLRIGARILDAGVEADPSTGTVRVTLQLDEVVDGVVPGVTVRATIPLGAGRRGLVVPDAAVVDAAGQTLVFVKTAPETFAERPVRVGARSGDEREILAGVEEGERVVVDGTYALRSLAGR